MLDEQTRLKMGQGKQLSSAMLNQSLLRSVGCYELDGPLSEPLLLHRHCDTRRGRGQGSGDSLREETEQSRWCLQAWVVDLKNDLIKADTDSGTQQAPIGQESTRNSSKGQEQVLQKIQHDR